MKSLAIDGGRPVRDSRLPYGRQWLNDDDIAAVVAALRSDWLTTGPRIDEFQTAFSTFTGASHAVAVSSGTAALHAAMFALNIQPGDEVIVPSMTFAATANAVLYQGGVPVFADVEASTLLLDPESAADRITSRTRAIIAVDYAGQPCDYEVLRALADRRGLALVADACHSIGGADRSRSVGTLAHLSCFSLHPVKHITTGEGGVITTDDDRLVQRLRLFRNHGITTDHRARERSGSWYYEMVDLGYNYRITDFQCALGISQLRKLPTWLERRREIASRYSAEFEEISGVGSLALRPEVRHAYHLYVIRVGLGRNRFFTALRAEGIGVNVHYIPVHLHPFYRSRLGTSEGLCPVAEKAYEQILSLPIFPQMEEADVQDVLDAVGKVARGLGSEETRAAGAPPTR